MGGLIQAQYWDRDSSLGEGLAAHGTGAELKENIKHGGAHL